MGSKNKDKHKIKKNATKGGDSAGKEKPKLIDDSRFSKVHYDPVFQNVPKNKSKVKIDSRFSGVFTDKKFATSSSARVDKRGKVKERSENELRRYYSDEDEEVKTTKKMVKKKKSELLNDDDEESSESASDEELSKSELSDSTASDDTDDDDDDVDGADISGDDASVEVENVPVIEKETHRLAVVNMDWTQVKAVDLFVMLSSCLPKGGQIKSVAVYPSEFGLKRMEEEAVHGPVALFEDEEKKDEGESDEDKGDSDEGLDDDDEDDEEDANEVSDDEEYVDVSGNEDVDEDDEIEGMYSEDEDGDGSEGDSDDEFEDDDEDDEIDNEKLRTYEKSRLRYYYAVVECDSVATADCLYKACDGIEFERSSNVLDLRFIPDSMEFKHQPRDVATEAPAEYEGLDFHTRALQQSNTVLSWDDDEPHRAKTLRRDFTEKQLAEMELNEFLASDESESDEDGDGDQDPSEKRKKKADMYRALIQSGDGLEEEDEGQNMEVTFTTGLEDISKKILEKKEKGSETVFEAYLRKKKEKRDARKNKSKNSSDDDSDGSDDQEPVEDPDDFFEEAPSAEKSKKDKQRKKKREEKTELEKQAEKSTAELELLLAEEDGVNKKPKGYKIKQKKAKGKKGQETADETNLPTVDVDDPRFSALFNNPGYALDPTDPQFKRFVYLA
ncbi:hypothetical protein RND81_11G235000 [Saponaria officinalis]|uniref:NUC153 domain-containing protein n=1 Tax=Saponaria officinalis TaxID=3572 RepID=A0AAW1HQL3_SAPOF